MYIMPLYLVVSSPNVILILWYTVVKCDSSFAVFGSKFRKLGPVAMFKEVWGSVDFFDSFVYIFVISYCTLQVILMKTLPGKKFTGPVTSRNNVPLYYDNGFKCYVVTMFIYTAISIFLYKFTKYRVTIFYDHFGNFLGIMTCVSLVLCLFLYWKGLKYPSSSDSGTTGNFLFDYYWGTELYPRIFEIDVKVFTNCRFGMTMWSLLVVTFALKNYELYGFVDSVWLSTALQTIYFVKFFWWESGYLSTIDIMMDRAGFYICWGCLAYISGLYASLSLHLATHRVILGWTLTSLIFAIGLTSIGVNYWADYQKQEVRRTNGACLIWGKKADVIRAYYELEDENKTVKTSLLLVSGFWGISRHFHYLPELLLALCWSVPAGFQRAMPYSYLFFLTILLVHRTFRDDTKCRKKYKVYWEQYCNKVPYKMIPGIF
ncbi:hypothetical protein HELRODRAFT_79313 [Helobdella robusta]|uniref:7-dehydrocholesterol reductase n=1 Tax=Helobdella robusta TaxID=6412 RepID=T1G3M5_HELRO|nr:hypothetical protein HELRODRAFT_79313 [Helobdella robusta]ESO04471.1 hypothetical protein HELRODRAFT_79313 [Helobdella robusta]